jgi:molecular chaperone HtpG
MNSDIDPNKKVQSMAFKAETRQLLDILIHSLYTEREIFLRELVSNASDALARLNFEMLVNRDILDPELPLEIHIEADKDEKTLTIRDSGLGMTRDEMVENLGTIAHSGARAFIEASKENVNRLADIIGQFGVGFYSAFMVAESIKVISRSYRPEAEAVSWFSTGADTFSIEPAEKADRGTTVIVKLKEDATEFLEDYRLRQILHKHSDYIAFPIYLGDSKEQINHQTALWRQQPREVKENEYEEFYKQLTLDADKPLIHAHLAVDAPVQLYALLYIPSNKERGVFSLRREDGLKLYARKVLIQEYCKDLLPEYFRFVQGVVDTEDLPLNVSRETVQANKIMAQLKKIITTKVTDMLSTLAKEDEDKYNTFWQAFGRYLKEGIATDLTSAESLYPLLRFRTLHAPDKWRSLDQYLEGKKEGQDKIYYILGDDIRSISHSPHLDYFRKAGYDVLALTDPIDSFMLLGLRKYHEVELANVAASDLKLPDLKDRAEAEEKPVLQDAAVESLINQFKTQLGERVTDVRMTERLSDSPARLVDPEGSQGQEMQRLYRLLEREFEAPKKVLELNPHHPIIVKLGAGLQDEALSKTIIEQIYEDALLIEGLHPDPASMIERIQELIQAALK